MAKKGAGVKRIAKRKAAKKTVKKVSTTKVALHEGIRSLGEGDLIIGLFLVVAGWLMMIIGRVDMWLTLSSSALIIAGLILVGFGVSDYIRSLRK